MRTRRTALLLVVVGCAAVAGCRGAGRGSDSANDRLIYWPPPNRFDIALAKQLVDAWNRSHPKIQVEMQPLPAGRSSEEVLLASIVGKTTPDICSNILTGTVERMVRAGALVRLSRFSDFRRTVNTRSPDGTLEAFRSRDGHVYQLPWKANPQVLFYNRALFARHGVSAPRSYSEFLRAARALSEDRDGDGRRDHWAFGWPIENTWWKRFDDVYPLFIGASGGKTLVDRQGRVTFDIPAMVGALTFLRETFARGYAPRSYFARELFLQGKVAMIPGSGPSIPDIDAKRPPGFRYGVLPFPVPDNHRGPAYTFGDIKSMVIFSSCKRPRAAWQFVKYLTGAAADLALIEQTRQLPLRRDLMTHEPFASALRRRPKVVQLARAARYMRGTDDTVDLVEILDTISQAYESGVVYGLRSPASAVARAARRVRRLSKMWR